MLDTLIVRSVLVTALNLDLGSTHLVAEPSSTGTPRRASPSRSASTPDRAGASVG